ncbi:MAG: hypothetical protein ACJA0G_002487 [Kangiellaceae bacterium]
MAIAISNKPTINTEANTRRPINLLIGSVDSFLSIIIMALNKLYTMNKSKPETIIFMAIVIPIIISKVFKILRTVRADPQVFMSQSNANN